MQPYGGTEIQLDYLKKYCPIHWDSVQLTTSIPEKEPLHPVRSNILWLKNSWDQPNIAPWFQNPKNHSKYDWYVFNSHWSYEKYRYFFKLDNPQCLVIKNGIDYDELVVKKKVEKKDKIKMVYFSTPWRGLEVLLKCMEQLKKDKDITLDVYSSTKIYGDAFQQANDKTYQPLYDKCKELPNVNYKGYCTHKDLLGKLHEYDVSAHPSIWEETFCISAMEALAAGLVLITTDLGAIPETCAEFPIYVPYTKDHDNLTTRFTAGIQAIKGMFKNDINDVLDFQKNYYKKFYDWNVIGLFWRRFLLGAYRDKREKIRKQNEV